MAKEEFAQHIENLKNQESWGRMKKATISDLKSLVHLALELWPGHTAGGLSAEFSEILAREDELKHNLNGRNDASGRNSGGISQTGN